MGHFTVEGRSSNGRTRRMLRVAFVCVLVGVILVNTHRLTCQLNVALCTSPVKQVKLIWRMRHDGRPAPFPPELELPVERKGRVEVADSGCAPSTLDLESAAAAANKLTQLPSRTTPRPLIVLCSQKSGSTWLQQKLDQSGDLIIVGEKLLGMTRDCSVRSKQDKACSWQAWKSHLERTLWNVSIDYPFRAASFVGFRLMYDHIPAQFRQKFANWVVCNNVTVLHFIREAVVMSFWTLQARAVDALSLGRYIDDSVQRGADHQLASNRYGIVLEPAEARMYVERIENNREGFRRLLKYHKGNCRRVKYFEVAYEDLIGPRANEFWKLLSTFLELRSPLTFSSRNRLMFRKLHPGTCASKIANWQQIKEALVGTNTLDACLAME